jgi:carbonic anhydrase/acetyltransferase-like protein (isoleucine patch superfamily)
MALFKTVRGKTPKFGRNCFFADNATVVGEVEMGDDCSVWFNAVLRGDVHFIKMGNKVNVQDGAVIHATYKKSPTTIGNNVSIAHNAVVHGCTIHNNVLIGMGAIIMDDAVVGSNCIIATGAVVTKGTVVEPNSVYAGTPAKKISDIGPELSKGEIQRIAESYGIYASWYTNENDMP